MIDEARPAPSGVARWLIWGFAAIGLLGVLAMIFLAAMVLGLRPEAQAPARVAGNAPTEQYSVQAVEEVRGTDLIQIDIGIGEPGGDSYSSRGKSAEQRNLILLNKLTGESRRLLADNGRRVEQVWLFPAEPEAQAGASDAAAEEEERLIKGAKPVPPPPYAYYALAVRRKEGPTKDLLVGNLASGQQAFVLSGIDGVDRIWMVSPTRVAVLLREKLKLHYRVIDIPALKIVTARPVDIG